MLPCCCWLQGGACPGRCPLLPPCVQVSNAVRSPSTSWLAGPPASWLDDFLSWLSPSLPQCCRAFPPKDPAGLESEPCPPPDQPPCTSQGSPCANCSVCFAAGHHPAPGVLVDGRPSLDQVSCCNSAHLLYGATSCKAILQEPRPMVLLGCVHLSASTLVRWQHRWQQLPAPPPPQERPPCPVRCR